MPTFKQKPNKLFKISKKYTATLDSKHKEFIQQFNIDEYDTIPRLKREKYILKKQLQEELDIPVDEKLDIEDKIQQVSQEIKQLKNNKTKYLLDNSKLIFEYFENKKNINNLEEPSKQITSKNQIIRNFFKIQSDDTSQDKNIIENNDIVLKYLTNVDETFIDTKSFVKETDICQSCFKGELIAIQDEGSLICSVCAVSIPYLVDNEKPSYKEPPKEVSFYAYKKINHFKEILAQFQGKETTLIPDDVIQQIQQQFKKERIHANELTHHKTKDILKKLGFNKYYEHIAFIKNKLGIKPPILSQELEDTLCNLFMEIQAPYAKTCPNYRINFLNYYYVLFKLCELLGETIYLNDIPLLKDREKLIEQDETWKKMCRILDWEFIPTV